MNTDKIRRIALKRGLTAEDAEIMTRIDTRHFDAGISYPETQGWFEVRCITPDGEDVWMNGMSWKQAQIEAGRCPYPGAYATSMTV